MNSRDHNPTPGRKDDAPTQRGQTRPPAPDTPELAERRAQAPAAQALIKATRKLLVEGGPEWATDKRIHETATRPGGRKGFPLGTIRYYFGGRERLLIHVARYEQLGLLDRVRRSLLAVKTADQLPAALATLADDLDHFQVAFALLTEGRQMPELKAAEAEIWGEWIRKLTEMVAELQTRGVVRPEHDAHAVALLWSSITAGLAAHHLANPDIPLAPALDLAKRYAASLP